MGRILCQDHGPSGIAFVCPHVRAAVLIGAEPPQRARYEIDIDGDVVLAVLACPQCAIDHQLPATGTMAWEDYDRAGAPGTAVCAACLASCLDRP
ncbi:MAG: hypothetical protein WKG01_09855 [Kofleriaceae bacterium]